MTEPRMIVICSKCGTPCLVLGYDKATCSFKYDYSKPCGKCVAADWMAHEVGRNWKTGLWEKTDKNI